jgi:hypothetical protein
LIVNLYCLHVTDPGRRIAVPLRKDSYQDSPLAQRAVSQGMKGLRLCGYVDQTNWYWDARRKAGTVTRFQATAKFTERFAAFDLTVVQIRERRPLIELRPSKQVRRELTKQGESGPFRLPWPAKLLSVKARRVANLRKMNAALQHQFQAVYVPDATLCTALGKHKRPVNLFQRDMHRVFTTDTDNGGRFAGAWWFTLPSQLRQHIRMSAPGKLPAATTELDYDALHFRMLYAAEGVPCAKDPYSIYDDPSKCRATRKAVKRVSLMMVNAITRPAAKLAAKHKINKGLFPEWWKKTNPGKPWPDMKTGHKEDEKMALMWPGCPPLETLMRHIEARHAPIAHHFCTGAGRGLMFKDSEIAERIMLGMIAKHGVAPLPVHDSFIVHHDYEDALRQAMQDEFFAAIGASIPISKKPSAPAAPDDVGGDSLYSRMLDAWAAAPAFH